MFKTSEDLKQFIIWAKQNGVQQVQVGKVTIVFSAYAMAEAELDKSPTMEARNTEHKNTSKSLVDTIEADEKEEEDLLFYSAK